MQTLAARESERGGARSVTRRCRMLAWSRAACYRRQTGRSERASDTELREQLQRMAVEGPADGYRRITAELQRCSLAANHKRVLRLMRDDTLLCLRNR
jgi:putative transposase